MDLRGESMDIISYGIASKAAKQEQFTRNDVLGIGVEGSYSNVKTRIDNLEKAIQGVVAQADKLIVNDAINIMKAHAKLNAVAKSMKYKMYNMIFDDLLDLSGIDTSKSSGYIHDAANGLIKSANENYVIETQTEVTEIIPKKAILTIEEENITENVALHKPVRITKGNATNLSLLTDGDFTHDGKTGYVNATEKAELEIDLGEIYHLSHIQLYLYWDVTTNEKRSYHENIVQVSKDSINWVTLYDSTIQGEIITSENGQRIDANGLPVRYIRTHANGNTTNNGSHWIELEAYPLKTTIGSYYISRDNGNTWESIVPDTLFYFTDSISPLDNKLRLKAELSKNTKLLNYALTWA